MSTYPPDQHVLRDLRFETQRMTAARTLGWAPIQPGVLAADGSMRTSAIAMMVDVAAAAVAIVAADPGWSATADLSYWTAAPITVGPAVCDARLVRAGSKSITVEADVFDGRGTDEPTGPLAGRARLTFARIPGSASVAAGRVDRSDSPQPRRSMHHPGSAFAESLHRKCGLRVVDAAAGIVECDKTDYVRNSFGTINGGVVGVILEAAAERLAGHAAGRTLVARDLQVHYLAQTEVGPARTSARVVRTSPDHTVVEARLVDAGRDDRVLAFATVTLTP